MNAEWRARNTDKRREYFAQERFVENRKRYKKDRPDVVRLADVRRRERKYGSASELSALDRERIRHIYAFRDWMTAKTGVRFEVDHVIPLARGGKHHPDNLQLLTAAANRRKGCKISAIQ
jgi:5-methylcytosine-specific restriction endonuclease McrA